MTAMPHSHIEALGVGLVGGRPGEVALTEGHHRVLAVLTWRQALDLGFALTHFASAAAYTVGVEFDLFREISTDSADKAQRAANTAAAALTAALERGDDTP